MSKNVLVQKMSGSKKFWVQNDFEPNNFWVKRNLELKEIWIQKISPNEFGVKKIDIKKLFDPTKIGSKKI